MNLPAHAKRAREPETRYWLAILLAWYMADYFVQVADLGIRGYLFGSFDSMVRSAHFTMFIGDRTGWSHWAPYWISSLIPPAAILCFAISRTKFSWRVALATGLVVVAAQLAVAVVFNHGLLFQRLWVIECFEKFPVVLIGPLVASQAPKFRIADPEEA